MSDLALKQIAMEEASAQRAAKPVPTENEVGADPDATEAEAVFRLCVDKLPPTHRKRAEVSWYRWMYATVFPFGVAANVLQVVGFGSFLIYMLFFTEHELFARESFEE